MRVLPEQEPLVLTRSFARLVQRLGLPRLTFHDLRHDAASTLTMAGVSQRAIMDQHLAPGHLQDAIRALDHPASGGESSAVERG